MVGTPLPPVAGQIIEMNLDQLRILAQWGRGRVEGLAWSPDASTIAVTTPLGIYLYFTAPDLSTPPVFVPTTGRAGRLAFSPDSRLLAVETIVPGSGKDMDLPVYRVQIWDLPTLRQLPPEALVNPQPQSTLETTLPAALLAFTDLNRLAVVVRIDGGASVQTWDLTTGQRTAELNLTGGETATTAAISRDFSLLATRGDQGPVRIWRLRDGALLAATEDAPTGSRAGPLDFAPDGSRLAVGYADFTKDFANTNGVRVWKLPTDGSAQAVLDGVYTDNTLGEGAEQTLTSLAWSPNGEWLAAGYADYAISAWRLPPNVQVHHIQGATLPRYLAWSPDSQHLAAGGLEIWRPIDTPNTPDPGRSTAGKVAYDDNFLPGLYDMTFAPDNQSLVLAEYGRIDFRATLNGTRNMEITGMTGQVNSLAFNPEGTLLSAACQDGAARLYLVKNGQFQAALGQPGLPVLTTDFSSNGWWVAYAAEDMKIQVYRVHDGMPMLTITEPYVSYRLRFAPNSDQIASLTTSGVNLRAFGGTIRRINAQLKVNYGGVGLTDMAYSPGAEHLALVGSDVVRVIDPLNLSNQTAKVEYTIYDASGALPWSVAFSPDNAFLAVGWSDGQIRFYWAADGTLLKTFPAHPEAVARLAFTRDGQYLASLGSEGTVRIWGIGQ